MAKRDKYHPDYKKLYPNEEITPEVMRLLKRSDRKMEYMEVDLKQGAFRQDSATQTAVFVPSREDSLERLQEEDKAEFTSPAPSPEEEAVHNDELDSLRKALEMLKSDERELIVAIYYDGLSEHQLFARLGVPQTTINYRKVPQGNSFEKFLIFSFNPRSTGNRVRGFSLYPPRSYFDNFISGS